MSMKTRIGIIAIAVGALAGNAALAADNAFYLGGSLGQARANFDTAGAAANIGAGVTNSEGIYKVYGGYQFHKNFSVEGTYINLGSYTATNGRTIEPAGWGLALVGAWPIGNDFSLLARLGEYRIRQKMNPTGVADNSWSPGFGAGLRYDFNANLSARGEIERIQKMGSNTNTVSNDSTVYTFGLGYKF
jgi:OOP family OmpA-OmpF porin